MAIGTEEKNGKTHEAVFTERNVIIAVIFFCIPNVREYTGVCVFPFGETSRPDRPKGALGGCSKDSKRTQQGRFDVDPPIRDICRYEGYFGGICAHLRNPSPPNESALWQIYPIAVGIFSSSKHSPLQGRILPKRGDCNSYNFRPYPRCFCGIEGESHFSS